MEAMAEAVPDDAPNRVRHSLEASARGAAVRLRMESGNNGVAPPAFWMSLVILEGALGDEALTAHYLANLCGVAEGRSDVLVAADPDSQLPASSFNFCQTIAELVPAWQRLQQADNDDEAALFAEAPALKAGFRQAVRALPIDAPLEAVATYSLYEQTFSGLAESAPNLDPAAFVTFDDAWAVTADAYVAGLCPGSHPTLASEDN